MCSKLSNLRQRSSSRVLYTVDIDIVQVVAEHESTDNTDRK